MADPTARPRAAWHPTWTEPSGPAYRDVTSRSAWIDLRALAWFVLLALAGLVMASVARNATAGLDEDLRNALAGAPRTILHIALVLLQGLALVGLVAFPAALALARHWGLLGRAVLAGVAGGGAFWALTHLHLLQPGADLTPIAAGLGPAPSSILIAAAAAVVATLRPVSSAAWLGPLWTWLALLAVLRTLASPEAPLDVVLAIGVGGTIGTGVLLAFGRVVHRLTAAGVAATLAEASTPVVALSPSAPALDSWQWLARTAPGTALGVDTPAGGDTLLLRVVDRYTWRQENLAGTYRRLRLRVFSGGRTASPVAAVTSEAMIGLLAADRGVHVPRVRVVARAPEGEALLAVDDVAGIPLADAADADVTESVLRAVWSEVAALHSHRIAHHALTSRALLVHDGAGHDVPAGDDAADDDAAPTVWITSFGRGQAGADDDALLGDVADLLASTYAQVGPARAVAPAVAVLGGDRVSDASRLLVPVALPRRTRDALKQTSGGLDPLLEEIATQTGVPRQKPLPIERFRPRTLVAALALVVAFYFLAPELAEWPTMIDSVRHADWGWLPLLLVASALTYVGCGIGLAGSTPGRVPPVDAGLVALASSFVATFSPPGLSTIGLNVRFLQQRGYPLPVAISASAAKEAAVVAVQVVLIVVFALWGGTTGVFDDLVSHLPSERVLVGAGVAVVVVVAVLLAVPRVRSLLRSHVLPSARQGIEALQPVMTSPWKMTQLVVGVALLPLGYAFSLFAASRAFDATTPLVAVVLVSLTAGSLASAAPTPGGIGAVEAVLTAALVAIGMSTSAALAAVLLYRLVTFWLPIPPGFVSFRVLTKREIL
ncbi:MAG: hypothetical protein BGO96_04925 [Micrococcales bacterium 73-15]|uniref:lysylphosphatidylglycerol synthase transmembrane domain-containing protein n=1 Tax=Salana multivorans TaxID=120377 RepID=UPI00096A1D07|nr:lysylphosphatidylglycerol synthase transmembrane domain-containing protein [Salana multivorans]OJX97290.1 MAG: hypothetical protein BGO96_04925 [Micrococcales bacterium 73-15]